MSKRIIIFSLQGLGNAVMLERVLRDFLIKKRDLVSLVVSDNGAYQFLSALHPDLQYFVWREGRSIFSNLLQLVKEINKHRYELGYGAYLSGRRENLLLFLTRAKQKKILKNIKGRLRLFEFFYPLSKMADPELHDIENNSYLFSAPSVRGNALTRDIAKKTSLKIGFNLGTKAETKRWDISNWIKVMDDLEIAHKGVLEITVILGKNEYAFENIISKQTNCRISFVVEANFTDLVAEIQGLDLVISTDSAIMHVSALLGVPTIAIWPYTGFKRVSPYGKRNVVIKKNYTCIPCYSITKNYVKKCKYKFKCIRTICPEEVSLIARKVIDGILSQDGTQEFDDLHFIENIETLSSGCRVVTIK